MINGRVHKTSNVRSAYTGSRKTKKSACLKRILLCFLVILLLLTSSTAFAYAAPAGEQEAIPAKATDSTGIKAISAGLAIALGAAAAAIAMGIAIAKSSESIARQPEAEGSIRTNLLLGLVFIETAVIYALVVAIMIIFVL